MKTMSKQSNYGMDKLDGTEDTSFSTLKEKRPVHRNNEEVMPNGIIDTYAILTYI